MRVVGVVCVSVRYTAAGVAGRGTGVFRCRLCGTRHGNAVFARVVGVARAGGGRSARSARAVLVCAFPADGRGRVRHGCL